MGQVGKGTGDIGEVEEGVRKDRRNGQSKLRMALP
jgi:hypothetical protein